MGPDKKLGKPSLRVSFGVWKGETQRISALKKKTREKGEENLDLSAHTEKVHKCFLPFFLQKGQPRIIRNEE